MITTTGIYAGPTILQTDCPPIFISNPPPMAVMRVDVFSRRRRIDGLHGFAVPVERLLHPDRHNPGQHNFGQLPAHLKIGKGRRPSIAGVDPFLEMSRAARQCYWYVFGGFMVQYSRQLPFCRELYVVCSRVGLTTGESV